MKWLYMLMSILFVTMLVLACGVTGSRAPEEYEIVYRVVGTTRAASLTIRNESGNTEQFDVSVPWTSRFTARSGAFLYVSAQNQQQSGSIGCTITVNGQEVEQAQSEGAYKIATCSGRL